MKKAGRGSAVDHEPPLATGAIEPHLSTAGTVRPRRGSRGVATFGRDAAFTIPLIRKRRSTLLLDPPMAASRQVERLLPPRLNGGCRFPKAVPGLGLTTGTLKQALSVL